MRRQGFPVNIRRRGFYEKETNLDRGLACDWSPYNRRLLTYENGDAVLTIDFREMAGVYSFTLLDHDSLLIKLYWEVDNGVPMVVYKMFHRVSEYDYE